MSYAPRDVTHLPYLIKTCWELTNITNHYEHENIFLELIDSTFCKHIHKRSKNKYKLCLSKHSPDSIYCKRHKLKSLNKCSGKNRNGDNCRRNVRREGQLCNYCIKKNVKIYKCLINISNIFIIEESYKYDNKIVPYFDFFNNLNIFIKKLLDFLHKHNILFYVLYLLLILKTSKNENKMQFHLLNKKEQIINNQIIVYEPKKYPIYIFNNNIYNYIERDNYDKTYKIIKKIYNKDFSNTIILLNKSYKNFKKNLKKRETKKKNKQKEKIKPCISFIEKVVDVKILNNDLLINNIDCGYMNIKLWPLKRESYKDILNEEIIYFHQYIYNKKSNIQVVIFYKQNNKFTYKNISYRELYNLFIIEFKKSSVLEFIKKYYKDFKLNVNI
jgi:hypothetical protein